MKKLLIAVGLTVGLWGGTAIAQMPPGGQPLPPGMTAPPSCMYDCHILNPTTIPTVPLTLPPGMTAPPSCMYDCNILNTTTTTEAQVAPVESTTTTTKAPAPRSVAVEPMPLWLVQLQAILVANGGW